MAEDTAESKLGKEGESKFREFCDNSQLVYLYIHQSKDSFSSEIWKKGQKRPDFLVTLPAVGSLLVDVKTQPKMEFYKQISEMPNREWAFTINIEDYEKLKNLQDETGLKVWYAFFETDKSNEHVLNRCYMISLSSAGKFFFEQHRIGNFRFLQVPLDCFAMGEGKVIFDNRCSRCMSEKKTKICELTKRIMENDYKKWLQTHK